MNQEYVNRVVDLTDPQKNIIYNMSTDEAVELVRAGDTEGVRGIDGQFALIAVEGKTIRMARSIGRPLRFFIAKLKDGPCLVLAERIDLQRLRLDPQALGALQFGNGEEEVVIFVDPRCPHCHDLMERLPVLTEHYRFLLVPLPVLGPDSEDAVARLGCLAATDAAAARDALLNDKADELPEPTPGCGQAPAQRALVTAQLLGIAGVPYLIAPDGRLQQGVPENLEAWLEGTP